MDFHRRVFFLWQNYYKGDDCICRLFKSSYERIRFGNDVTIR